MAIQRRREFRNRCTACAGRPRNSRRNRLEHGPGPSSPVGGTVSGLSGTVVPQNNGSDSLSVSTGGPFASQSDPGRSPTTSRSLPARRTELSAANGQAPAVRGCSNVAVAAPAPHHRRNVSACRKRGIAAQRRQRSPLSANGNFSLRFLSDHSPATSCHQPAGRPVRCPTAPARAGRKSPTSR
jgi:hypothetical protein